MKYLRKFNSVQEMNAAAETSLNGFTGLAYGNNGPVLLNYVPIPQHNDEIWYTTNNGSMIEITWPGGGGSGSGSGSGSGVTIVENTYEDGKGILKFSGDLTEIPSNTFYGYSQLTSITIPDSVTTIGGSAFYDCAGLTSITIGSGVTSIGESAFYNCTGLTTITIPDSVTTIGQYAFNGCSGLTSITIPDRVTSIGNNAFYRCTGLTSIVVDSNNSTYDSRNNCNAIIDTSSNTLILGCKNTVIPSTVTSIGYSAFSDCTGLTSITIPSSVTSIGGNAFYNCTGLTSITIPNSVTSIGYNAFEYCSGLTSITIPDSVTSIGYSAFNSCTGLTSITCEATTPPTLDSTAFGNTNDCLIYVPVVSVDTYKAASGWRDYASRIQAIP